MPNDYKRTYPAIRLIVDGMERLVKKPKNPLKQQATYGKNRV